MGYFTYRSQQRYWVLIFFFKKDVYEGMAILGSSADYESLKESARTAAAKIK
jgi:hypothetical protein